MPKRGLHLHTIGPHALARGQRYAHRAVLHLERLHPHPLKCVEGAGLRWRAGRRRGQDHVDARANQHDFLQRDAAQEEATQGDPRFVGFQHRLAQAVLRHRDVVDANAQDQRVDFAAAHRDLGVDDVRETFSQLVADRFTTSFSGGRQDQRRQQERNDCQRLLPSSSLPHRTTFILESELAQPLEVPVNFSQVDAAFGLGRGRRAGRGAWLSSRCVAGAFWADHSWRGCGWRFRC